jgi:VanZ family protein
LTADDRQRVGATVLRWLPAVAWMAVIFMLSSQSGLRVSDDVAVERPFRVLAHLGAYALLAGLLLFALCGANRPTVRAAAIAGAIAMIYALSDELHQSFVPDRTGRADDLVVDGIGVVIGLALGAIVLLLVQRRPRGQAD